MTKDTYSTHQMTYRNREFTVEASTIGFSPAAAVTLKSHKTGRLVTFRRVGVTRDRDGDIQTWEYISDVLVGSVPLGLRVFND